MTEIRGGYEPRDQEVRLHAGDVDWTWLTYTSHDDPPPPGTTLTIVGDLAGD